MNQHIMQQITLFLIMALSLISCQPKIDGIWQIANLTNENGKIEIPPKGNLFDFEDDSIHLTVFSIYDNDGHWKSARTENGIFKLTKNELQLSFGDEHEMLKIHTLTEDSIILSPIGETTKMTLKRILPVNSKNVSKGDLINNAFYLKTSKSDSLYFDFINEKLILLGENYSSTYWDIVKYKQMKFLVINNDLIGSFQLVNTQNNKLQLQGKTIKNLNLNLNPVELTISKKAINGNWIEIDRHPKPPLPIHIKSDTLEQLSFLNDRMVRSRFHQKEEREYQLTNDGKAIYFDQDSSAYIFRRIQLLYDSTLILEKVIDQDHWVKYKRM